MRRARSGQGPYKDCRATDYEVKGLFKFLDKLFTIINKVNVKLFY
jgi:hypothetical protein